LAHEDVLHINASFQSGYDFLLTGSQAAA